MVVSAEDNNLLDSHCIDSIHKVGKIVTTKIITKGSVRGETQEIQKTEQIIDVVREFYKKILRKRILADSFQERDDGRRKLISFSPNI